MEGTSDERRGLRQPSSAPALADTFSSGNQQDEKVRDRSSSSRTHPAQGLDVKCCRRQHEVLVTYIRHTLQCWGPLDELPLSYWIDGTVSAWKPSSAMQVTPELKRVLLRGKILSEDCCREFPPLKLALRHAELSDAFSDILNEIQWCTSVVYHGSMCRDVTMKSAPELKGFPWQVKLGCQEQVLLQKAEQDDWQELMRQLEKWNQSHLCSAEDCGNIHGDRDRRYCGALPVLKTSQRQAVWPELVLKSSVWSFDKEAVKFVRPLGSGAFGQVVEVTWMGFNYAQKIFSRGGLHTLHAEVDALVKMKHPHIVKVFAHSEDSLVMDLMCMNLHEFMRCRMKGGARVQPFSLPAAIDLMLQIADALSYIHTQNMTHRDLKASNILINPVDPPGDAGDDGFVFAKVADFGLAKVKREITRYSHLTHNVGTRKWMAPEIFGANIEDDHPDVAYPMKADVYSFGIVCFEIWSGKEPFEDEKLTTLYSKLTAPFPLRPRLPSSCPTSLASLICACWDTDPQKRPAFADVCRVLRYLKGLPTLLDLNDMKPVSVDGEWPFGRLTVAVEKEYYWGPYPNNGFRADQCDSMGPIVDIRAVKIHFRDIPEQRLTGFDVSSYINGQRDERTVGSDSRKSTDWITFDHPSEYLVQVEGSLSERRALTSITLITTKQKYGPYGRSDASDIPFSSDRGMVVSLKYYFCDLWTVRFRVNVTPNITGCLRQYLDNENPFP